MNRRDFIRTAVGALAAMPLLNPAYMAAEYATSLPESQIDVLEPEQVLPRLRELAGSSPELRVLTGHDFLQIMRYQLVRKGPGDILYYATVENVPYRYDRKLKIVFPYLTDGGVHRINPEWLSAPIEVVLGYAGSSIFIAYSHRPKIQF